MAQTITSMMQLSIDYHKNKYGHYVATVEQVEKKVKEQTTFFRIIMNNHVLHIGKEIEKNSYVTRFYLDGQEVFAQITPNYL